MQNENRLINQSCVRHAFPLKQGNEPFSVCWEGALSPQGIFYFSLCAEEEPAATAKLVRYRYDTNAIEECFCISDAILYDKRLMPPNKIHTSIDFLPDGRVICATFGTAKAAAQPEWMPFGCYADPWEGFPGSYILVYDPETSRVENWGMPVQREAVYGMKYDKKHNRLYMIGFMRGHIYSLDLDTRLTCDLGKAAAHYTYRLHLGPDGHIYGGCKAGDFFRVNTETNVIEDLGFVFPEYRNNVLNNTWYRYMTKAVNHPNGRYMYLVTVMSEELFRLDVTTMMLQSVGRLLPEEAPFDNLPYHLDIWSMSMDSDGVLWYTLGGWGAEYELSSRNTTMKQGIPSRLFYWDIEKGKRPQYVGIAGSQARVQQLVFENAIDRDKNILYLLNVGRGGGEKGPDVLAVELDKLKKVCDCLGPVSADSYIYPRMLTAEEAALRQQSHEENKEPQFPFWGHPFKVVRLWRKEKKDISAKEKLIPRVIDGKYSVLYMDYDEDGILEAVTGSESAPCLVFRIAPEGTVICKKEWRLLPDSEKERIVCRMQKRQKQILTNGRLPGRIERDYLAKQSAYAEWQEGKHLIGTEDGMLAIQSEKKIYSLGAVIPYGPVRDICTNKEKTAAWGVGGDKDDIGYVFQYDEENGVRQLGTLTFNSPGYSGVASANVLSAVAYDPAAKRLAVGSADLHASIFIFDNIE
ncbi:MAG: hypothetical protein UFG06_12200 [Lachnospiraceae bacterium]|nr:hypothetical protein [Lachnospiraceae bacterium]